MTLSTTFDSAARRSDATKMIVHLVDGTHELFRHPVKGFASRGSRGTYTGMFGDNSVSYKKSVKNPKLEVGDENSVQSTPK
jgi:hypothetical protein